MIHFFNQDSKIIVANNLICCVEIFQ